MVLALSITCSQTPLFRHCGQGGDGDGDGDGDGEGLKLMSSQSRKYEIIESHYLTPGSEEAKLSG